MAGADRAGTSRDRVETNGMISSTPMAPYGRGDLGRTPFFKNFDLNLAHDFMPLKSKESVRVRLEFSVFNLFNNFNWGNPTTNLDAGTFGRITTGGGDPRIMQFGVKYGF